MLFDSFGPYHIARLDALASACDLIAIEFFENSSEYSWGRISSSGFERVTLMGSNDVASVRTLAATLRAALDRACPDVIFVPGWDSPGATAALTWERGSGTRVVVMSDSQERDAPRSGPKEWVKRQILCHSDGMFVAGSRHRDYGTLLGMPRDRIRMGYDVVDNDHFSRGVIAARRDEVRPLERPYFLASARFLPRKNITGLLRGYARHQRAQPDAAPDLVVMGDGPERAAIEAEVAALGLGEAVHLPGFVAYNALPRYLAFATAFVHVPISEQWGLVVNEAMASGLPVIVSDACGCAPELVAGKGCGTVVNAGDEEGLAAAMNDLVGMPQIGRREMGRRAREVIAEFTPETFRDQCLELSQYVLCHPPRQDRSLLARGVMAAFQRYRTR